MVVVVVVSGRLGLLSQLGGGEVGVEPLQDGLKTLGRVIHGVELKLVLRLVDDGEGLPEGCAGNLGRVAELVLQKEVLEAAKDALGL